MSRESSVTAELSIQHRCRKELPGRGSTGGYRFSRPGEPITLVRPCPDDLGRKTQVLARSFLDDKLRQRCLLLLSKICKAHGNIPASYVLQWQLIRAGEIRYRGGSADVRVGTYMGSSVAIKYLKMNEEDFDRMFKVPDPTSPITVAQSPASGCVERSSAGNTCPIRTSCLC